MLTLTSENFEKEVLKADRPVLVDFYADWCAPCKLLAPIIEELAEELKDKVKVAELDVDANKETAVQHNVMGVPTLILFEKGEEAKRLTGLRDKASLKKELGL